MQKVLNTFDSEIFLKGKQGKGLTRILECIAHITKVFDCKISDHSKFKILTLQQILQRLLIALAQVKAGNTSENVLNEIRQIKQIIYSLYQAKGITKRVYNNIMNSIKLCNGMDTISMNCGNSKTSDPHRLLLNLSEKINLKRTNKNVASSNLSICYT